MEKKNINAIIFPGQGSQRVGMGSDLFEKYRELTDKASAILGYSVEELCLKDPDKKLNLTQYTQPALYVVNALSYLDIREKEGELKPDYLLGHSLGEYDALFAAGVFDFETGVKLVQRRGQLMSEAKDGTMAAILSMDIDQLQSLLEREGLKDIDIANYNTPKQLVLSGPKERFEGLQGLIEANKGGYVPLKVSAAFHSRLMKEAREQFAQFLEGFTFSTPEIPVIANVTAAPYGNGGEVADLLARQITGSVHWAESIIKLLKKYEVQFTEVYGNKLSNMIKHIRKHDLDDVRFLEKDEPAKAAKPAKKKPVAAEKKKTPVKKNGKATAKNLKAETTPAPGYSKNGQADSGGIKPKKDITLAHFADNGFARRYGIKLPYVAGAMYRGISSKELVVQMGKNQLIGYLGTGGMGLQEVSDSIAYIREHLDEGQAYGMNLLCNLVNEDFERDTVALYLEKGVRYVEAAAFMQMTKSLVWYRAAGFYRAADGSIESRHHVLAKCSRPEVAERYMSPPPQKHLNALVEEGKITADQAEMAAGFPMSTEVCIEADSGGHTDMGLPGVLFPTFRLLRDELAARYNYSTPIYLGLAGGIGSPEAVVSSFVLGADFVLTGSINQCTPQAGQSDVVKDELAGMNVQDTDYAPAGDMFEIGAKIQVLKKGLFFPARAKYLHQLYTNYNSLDELPAEVVSRIETQIFKKSIAEVWADVEDFFTRKGLQSQLDLAQQNPKHRMALVFRWYYGFSSRVTQQGDLAHKTDFQVHTGPALGAFNQYVKGTELEDWRNRDVNIIAEKLMSDAHAYLDRLRVLQPVS